MLYFSILLHYLKSSLDQLGQHTPKKHNTQMRNTGINMVQNFTEFY
jgi:hypothetical protein